MIEILIIAFILGFAPVYLLFYSWRADREVRRHEEMLRHKRSQMYKRYYKEK